MHPDSPHTDRRRSRALEGLRVAVTGKLASMRRDEARARIAAAGGRLTSTVSGRTDLVVVGMEGWPVLPDGSISRKLETAEQLRRQGHALEIIAERCFLERLGLKPAVERGGGSCSMPRAAQILGVSEQQLWRWQQFGLISSDPQGRLAYRQLVSLRQIARLLARGVPVRALTGALERLRALLRTEEPLSQLRLLERSGELVAELAGTRFDLAGQLELFAPPRQQPTVLDAPRPLPRIEALFDYGADCEDEGRWLEAAKAYEQALALAPDFHEARYNLGNVYRARGQLELAVEAYRGAARSQDTELAALSLYNLGYVLDELGRYADAAGALRRCLELAPEQASARFNLALCYESLDDPQHAAQSWREYLRLDGDSDWARVARRRLFVAEHRLRGPQPPAHG